MIYLSLTVMIPRSKNILIRVHEINEKIAKELLKGMVTCTIRDPFVVQSLSKLLGKQFLPFVGSRELKLNHGDIVVVFHSQSQKQYKIYRANYS